MPLAFSYRDSYPRRLQAPKCWFLAPSGARNQDFENPRLFFRCYSGFLFAIFGRASGQIFEKMQVLAPLGLATLVCSFRHDSASW